MYNLLGDPLLRLQYPRNVQLEVASKLEAGSRVPITGTAEVDGACLVELVCRRDRLTFDPPGRREFVRTSEALSALTPVYRKANDGRWTWESARVEGGRLETELLVPEDAHGPCHVRVFVQGENDYAIGAAEVNVTRSAKSGSRTNVATRRTRLR
jgi:hypothetical protein